ncbi:camphor resistance protein CrcB [Amylibacter kogurei]|uniref:Fluoride-specific ion channel FluC n=1 Tax=Paramylibacter kogurei TaxID=1889778 RepID=A0A2G5K7M6_9RHOB|nr:fluoride efflux transporter CrcB [Amylibacter kogurei]PIB25022.1 camphor resistance protein CrcB [Amylibacter kogurei]
MSLLHVAIGGALGAMLRYLVGISVAFPYGTLVVNVLGSFIMGLVFVMFVDNGLDRWVPLVMVGLLGGFTTFSAFSLDVLRLIETDRAAAAFGYVLASVVLSLAAIFVAVFIARSFAQ